MKRSTDVVIVGGGVIGCSIAYVTLVFEQDDLIKQALAAIDGNSKSSE
jgi:glycerol-3-phosphate dehydrogenase